MKKIPLTQGKTALIDDEDFQRVSLHKWTYKKSGYAETRIANKHVYLHRFIMNAKPDEEIDHKRTGFKDHGLDCQKENLRFCTHSQNSANRTIVTGISGFKGVCPSGKKWRADIRRHGYLEYLGCFETPEEAAHVYDQKAIEYFGPFATLNYPLP